MAVGRPRGFDRDTALERALEEFWRHGYEAASITALTAAMGIRPPSLYAAFGDKRRLFGEAVRHYQRTHGAFTTRALAEEPTARQAVERMLREAAVHYTDPAHPPGCLVISAAVNHGPDSADVEAELRALREAAKHAVVERISRDIAAGLLPADTDAEALGTYYAVIVQGMSRQAQDGADARALDRVATLAMAAWPAEHP
ncbi:TetR/AcrR family transcriptional regulator [Actinomadura craniellae]|uniref:TetR/AcrR family transcriptional regulator n=1 Tax=Actinomadura craniellae TaxID=2231787 RepID=A0A365H9G4_9ACTN|nr:TetR/AcrR family transcriptional regulator [Actinomadura craniellae]RAY15727.1 TetR/AcrR family transcriptional regulator [Actinomadura craniellae]